MEKLPWQKKVELLHAKAEEELFRNPLYKQPAWVTAHARLLALCHN